MQKRALVLKMGQIGDVIMAIPAVHALHSEGYEIHWICGRAVLPLLQCYSWIRAIPADDGAILFGGPLSRLRAILSLWREIGLHKYDLCATLYYDNRYRILVAPVRAVRKIMLSRSSRDLSLLASRHHADEYARVLLGWNDTCRDRSMLPIKPDRLPESPLSANPKSRRIVLVPGGVKQLVREQVTGRLEEQALRRWPLENYVTVAEELVRRGWEVLLLGSAEDVYVRPAFVNLPTSDYLGTLSLPAVVSLCDAADAVITHDTGPLHLAGLSSAAIISIFGPTDPSTRVPRRPFAVGIWGGEGFACRPCYDGANFAPCTSNGCMQQVSPALVLLELDQLLAARSEGRHEAWHVVHPTVEPRP